MTKISNLYALTNYIDVNSSGNVVIATPTSGFALDVTGTGRFTGQLTLGSTITNGTFTYTLPAATGTLALTSALGSYLPLSGGTLTGALNGTSATFTNIITANSTDGISGLFRSSTFFGSIDLENTGGAATGKWNLQAVSGAQVGAAAGSSFGIYSYGASAYRMFINSSGNVGINTILPNDFIDGERGMAILQSTNGRAVLSLVGTRVDAGETLGRISFTNTNSTNAGSKRLAYINGARGTTNNSAYLEFAVANNALGTVAMTLSQAGNLLVNTGADAGFRLDVFGQARIYQSATNSVNYLNIYNNRTRNAAVLTETTNGGFYAGTSIGTDTFNYQIYDGNAGAARLTISSTGTSTFSTTENQGGLYVTSATDNTTLRIASTATNGQEWRLQSTGGTSGLGQGKLIFKVGGTETASHIPLTLTTDNSTNGGRVGIGTSSPSQRLDVAGNIVNSGYIYTNGNLATANGNQTANSVSASLFLGNRGYFSSPDIGAAQISAISTGTNWFSGTAMAFYTNPGPDVTGIGNVERMRITSSGNMLIATASDVGGRLQVNGDIRAYGSFFRETGNITVNNSWTNVFTINTGSQRTYLLQIIATNSEASLSYRYFGVIQGNPASSSYTSVSLASQTMEVQFSGATIQTRLTNSNQFNFNWSITQLL